MANFGTVAEIEMIKSSSGKFKGKVYVTFETIKSAAKAMKMMDKQKFQGKTIKAKLITDDDSEDEQSFSELFGNGLSDDELQMIDQEPELVTIVLKTLNGS